jgi:hypothetical protein
MIFFHFLEILFKNFSVEGSCFIGPQSVLLYEAIEENPPLLFPFGLYQTGIDDTGCANGGDQWWFECQASVRPGHPVSEEIVNRSKDLGGYVQEISRPTLVPDQSSCCHREIMGFVKRMAIIFNRDAMYFGGYF